MNTRRVTFGRFLLVLSLVALAFAGSAVGACGSDVPGVEGVDGAPPEPSTPPSVTARPSATGTGTAPPTDPNVAKVPVATAVSPDRAVVGAVGPNIVVTGNNFVARSVIQLDGAELATTFVSATELRASIPSNKLTAVGTLRISVGTAPPGGGASKELTFEVQNPTPDLTQLSPLSVVAGSPATAVTLTGGGFVAGAKVSMGTTDLTTTFKSATELSATVPASMLVASGSFPVKVTNPAPGGGASSAIVFTVTNPNVTLTQITPATANVGGPAVAITLDGAGFLPSTSVLFNGASITSAYVSGVRLTATIPAASLAAVGDFPVTVSNPPPGGGLSAPTVFRVQYAAPTLSSVSPAAIQAGAGATQITATGANFYTSSQLTLDGVAAATTFVNATTLRATIPAASLVSAGAIAVRVVNPTPGGGTSAAVSVSVENPAPVITSLSPNSATVGSPDRPLSVLGTGFVPASVVRVNGVPQATTYTNATQLTTTLASSFLANPGAVLITVMSPAPGGGTSAAATFTVGCDTTGVNVQLGPVGNTTTLQTSFATAPTETGFEFSGGCPGILSATVLPVRYWVVQNSTSQPVTLAAWGVCSSVLPPLPNPRTDDAFISFYKRATVPVTTAEREGCVGAIAEGTDGAGAFSAPDPDRGGAPYCPGLTKANGGGLVLGVCEKAVVRVQPYSMTSPTFTPPPQIRIRSE